MAKGKCRTVQCRTNALLNQKIGGLNDSGGGSDCPVITLGDLLSGQQYVGYNVEGQGAIVTGGQAPYTFTVTSGVLPNGATGVQAVEVDTDIWAWVFEGSTFSFGSSTFTIGGTDDNGCAITPREYTIEVWQEFVASDTPTTGVSQVQASGLPGVSGVDYRLDHFTFSYTQPNLALRSLNFTLGDPIVVYGNGDLSGTTITNAKIYSVESGFGYMAAGAEPYTGSYIGNDDTNFSFFDGTDFNDGPAIISSTAANITFFSITVKPL